MNQHPRIGEVYLMRFSGAGSVQRGLRPGVVFQNNVGNAHSPNIVALPITSSLKRLNQLTHVLLLSKDTGLRFDSMVLCENPETIPKSSIGEYITTLSDEYLRSIAVASALASSAIACLDSETLLALKRKAEELNAA